MRQETDKFPMQPVKLIVPFGAGGSVDAAARDSAKGLSELWSQPVVDTVRVPVRRSGNALVARAPHGYTLLFVSSHIVITPAMFDKLPTTRPRISRRWTLAANVPIILVAI